VTASYVYDAFGAGAGATAVVASFFFAGVTAPPGVVIFELGLGFAAEECAFAAGEVPR
jgi:hypothetical protein